MSAPHFTEPTTEYWQEILDTAPVTVPPWQYGFPARLPDSRILMLPIRPLNTNKDHAVASLLVNQASINVVNELGAFLAELVGLFQPEVIIGLPTLGLSLAPVVAEGLGLSMLLTLLLSIDSKGVLSTLTNWIRKIRASGLFAQILVRRRPFC
jgi:hypothetical protein